jgi:hypothetical protein
MEGDLPGLSEPSFEAASFGEFHIFFAMVALAAVYNANKQDSGQPAFTMGKKEKLLMKR